MVPVAILLAGPSGIAKSSLIEQIYTEVYARVCSESVLEEFVKKSKSFVYHRRA